MDPATWYFIITLVVSVGLSIAMQPKTPKPPPASMSDFSVPTAEEGRPIPVVFGTVIVTGPNVVWYGDLRNAPVKTKSGK